MVAPHRRAAPHVQAAARQLRAQHHVLRRRHPSALDPVLRDLTAAVATAQGDLRCWLELLLRAYWACDGRAQTPAARRHVETVMAAFAASMGALDVLDDLADGDEPLGGRQAPNAALALLGQSIGLLGRLPAAVMRRLVPFWGEMWARCAAAQARDVALSEQRELGMQEALAVAAGSGVVTHWAVEAGALLADAPPALLRPLAEFGQHLGTAEKLLHDLHDLWPGSHPSSDLHRPNCNLALLLAREHGVILPVTPCADRCDDAQRHALLASGVLHCAWAYADQYRLRAAGALDRFAAAGGDPAPLADVLALSADLRLVEMEDAQL